MKKYKIRAFNQDWLVLGEIEIESNETCMRRLLLNFVSTSADLGDTVKIEFDVVWKDDTDLDSEGKFLLNQELLVLCEDNDREYFYHAQPL
jgi:hypothetical protein